MHRKTGGSVATVIDVMIRIMMTGLNWPGLFAINDELRIFLKEFGGEFLPTRYNGIREKKALP
jgi:hypothetical protein